MRSKRLAVVLDLAEREKDQATQEFELARQQCLQEEQKLTQLIDYYRDYQQSFAAKKSLRVEELIKQRSFLDQLAQAQKQQQALIRSAQANLETKRAAWQKSHMKHKNLAQLINRYRVQEELALSKKEQKMLDEWFQQTRTPR